MKSTFKSLTETNPATKQKDGFMYDAITGERYLPEVKETNQHKPIVTVKEDDTKDAFKLLGLSDAEAEIAAREQPGSDNPWDVITGGAATGALAAKDKV